MLENTTILEVNSPGKANGPYVVVHKKTTKPTWAVVALCWEDSPTLAIRWFNTERGFPYKGDDLRSTPLWFVIPHILHKAILDELLEENEFKDHVKKFLGGSLTGQKLAEFQNQ